MNDFSIKLSKKNIMGGIPGSQTLCPISLTVKEKFPDIKEVKTMRGTIIIKDKDNGISYYNHNGEKFIHRFDEFGSLYKIFSLFWIRSVKISFSLYEDQR